VDGLPGEPWLVDGLDGLELPGLPGLPCEPDGGDDEGGCGSDWLVSLDVAQPASASAPANASPVHEDCLRHIPRFSIKEVCPPRPAAMRPDSVGSGRPDDGSTQAAGAR
jgi:hypothetical protein